ncbi:MAG: hypothetical protein WC764_01845 [Candidatus Paceibacterota bacterium]|jgi:hypothetical protein
MDTITKGGVIWEYLKGEVTNGKEDVTKADLIKVGYSVQAIENAIAEIKKDRLVTKPAMPIPTAKAEPVAPKPVTPPAPVAPIDVPLMTHPADQDLMNDLSAAIKQDTKIEFASSTPAVAYAPIPAPVAAPRGMTLPTPAAHENLAQSLSTTLTGIPTMPMDLMHPSVPQAEVVPKAIPIPAPAPKTPPGAVISVMPKKKHGIFYKLAMVVLVLVVLASIGSGVSFAMTGSWLPPALSDQISKLPFVSSFFERYPKDQLFGAMLGKFSSINTFGYSASIDVKTEPYDNSVPRPPKALVTGSTTPAVTGMSGYGMPADMTIHADISGSADITDSSSVLNKNGQLHGTLTGTVGGVSFTSEASFMKIGETFYAQLNKLPSLGLFDLSKVEGKWVKFDKTTADEFGFSLGSMASSAPQVLSAIETMQNTHASATYLANENIGDTRTYKYDVKLDTDPNVAMQVWIDPQTAFPVKVHALSKIAYDESDPATKDKMMVTESSLTLSDINTPISLVAPGNVISAVEAYASLSGMTLDQYYEHKQETNVSSIFYALGSYKTVAGEFPMSLSELMKTPNQIRLEHPQTAKKPTVKAGFDFAPWGDDVPVISKIPKDVFTKTDYAYISTKKDFTLKYEIRLEPVSTSSPSLISSSQFVNGMNTMTSKVLSVEGAAATKKARK